MEYPINPNLSLDLNLKAMIHDHNTQLESNSVNDEINHKTTLFGGLGLVYRFGYEKPKTPVPPKTKELPKKTRS